MKVLPVFLAIVLTAGAIMPGMASSQEQEQSILRVAAQDDIRGLNPFTTGGDHWTELMTQWIYDTPMFYEKSIEKEDHGSNTILTYMPYIAVGSANISGKAECWDDCSFGNFGYCPKAAWKNASRPEAVIFYDFENVFWHDGHQMDIRDVLFSYHAWAQYPYGNGGLECLKAGNYSTENWLGVELICEKGNAAALRFTLQQPYWQFFNRTLAVRLLPEHIWAYQISGQNVNAARIWCDADYNITAPDSWKLALAQRWENLSPVGSGVFKFSSWLRGQTFELATWRGHFFKPGYKYEEYCLDEYADSCARQPRIDGMSFKIYKTSEAAIYAMRNFDIDYIAWSIPPTFIQELANEPGLSLQQAADHGFTFLAYNMRKSSFGYKDGNPANGDAGKPLRHAIAHLIDKNRITTRLLLCLGIGAEGPLSSINPWYNKTIPRYSFDPDEAKQILADAGYMVKKDGALLSGEQAVAAAGAGTWWVNPDGTPIGSSTGGLIEILSPDANYDPIRAQAGLMICEQLRNAGIYAESIAMMCGDELDRVHSRDYDICVLPAFTNPDPTDFLEETFSSEFSTVGNNIAGYQNSSFDTVMDLARSTGNTTTRRQAISTAQASICYDLPFDFLYFTTNVEAYRHDRFMGWEVWDETLLNIQSLRNIQCYGGYGLYAQFISPPSAIVSNSTDTLIVVCVRDQDGNPVEGAQVWLNASLGKLDEETGLTTSTGKFATRFTAPYVDPTNPDLMANGTPVIIQIREAKYADSLGTSYWPAAGKLQLITVFPGCRDYLSMTMTADPDVISHDIGPGGDLGFSYITVNVQNHHGEPVIGASVALMVSPDVPTIEPRDQLTDENGQARFKVTAQDLPENDGACVEYVIKAIGISPTDSELRGEQSCHLIIVDAAPEPPRTESGLSPAESAATIVVILAIAAIVSYAVKRRKN